MKSESPSRFFPILTQLSGGRRAALAALALAALGLGAPFSARATDLAYEGFAYPAGISLVTASGTNNGDSFGFATRWFDLSGAATNLPTSLTYTDQFGHATFSEGGSARFSWVGNTANAQGGRSFNFGTLTNSIYSGITNAPGTYWMSFMVQWIGPVTAGNLGTNFPRKGSISLLNGALTNLTSAGFQLIDFGSPNANVVRPAGAQDTHAVWRDSDNLKGFQSTDLSLQAPTFIVTKFVLDGSGTNDTAYIFYNWPDITVEPDNGSANITFSTNFDGINGLRFDANGGNASGTNAVIAFDEFHLGTTFADVAPQNCSPAGLVGQPQSVVNFENLAASFSIIRGGHDNGAAPTNIWQVSADNGSTWATIPAATNTTYTLDPILLADNGKQFRAIVGVGCSGTYATSTVATLTVNACQVAGVSASPTNKTVAVGQTASFSAAGTGSIPLYQWQVSYDSGASWLNLTNGSGFNSTNFTTPVIASLTNSGSQYRAIVSSGCNGSTATSAVATLTVTCTTLAVTTPPANTSVLTNAGGVFTVATTGSLPLYQWQTNNGASGWVDVPNATNATYTTTNALLEWNGLQVRVVITVPCDNSTITTTPVTLSVGDPGVAIYRSAATGNWNAPATWQWSFDGGTTWFNATAVPNTNNNAGTVIQSPHVVSVTADASIDQCTINAGAEINIVNGVSSGFAVGGTGTALDVSGTLRLSGTSNNNKVTTNGLSTIVFESGGRFILNTTTASQGGMIPRAIWKDGSSCDIIGYTSAAGTFPANGSVANGGLNQDFYDFNYRCTNQSVAIVFSAGLTNVRHDLTILIGSPTQTAGSLQLNSGAATTLNVGGNFTVTTFTNANNRVIINPATSGAFENINVGGDLTVTAPGGLTASLDDSVNIAFNGTNGVQTAAIAPLGIQTTRRFKWTITPGSVLKLLASIPLWPSNSVLSTSRFTNNGTLDLAGLNQTCSAFYGSGVVSNSGAAATLTVDLGLAGIGGSSFSGQFLDRVNVAETSGTLQFTNGASNNYLGNAATLSIAASSGASNTVDLGYTGAADTIGALRIGGVVQAAGIWGSLTSGAPNTTPRLLGTGTLNVQSGPVLITTALTNQTVAVGQSVTFTAAASGSPAPTFQWYKNGVPLPSETNATLTVTAQLSDNGAVYTFTADNGFVSASSSATLTVIGPVTLGGVMVATNGGLQFTFSGATNATFTVLTSTDVALPLTNWTVAGTASNTGSGVFQFTSSAITNAPQRFFLVVWP